MPSSGGVLCCLRIKGEEDDRHKVPRTKRPGFLTQVILYLAFRFMEGEGPDAIRVGAMQLRVCDFFFFTGDCTPTDVLAAETLRPVYLLYCLIGFCLCRGDGRSEGGDAQYAAPI